MMTLSFVIEAWKNFFGICDGKNGMNEQSSDLYAPEIDGIMIADMSEIHITRELCSKLSKILVKQVVKTVAQGFACPGLPAL